MDYKMLETEIEIIRRKLNNLVMEKENFCDNEEILKISRELDELLNLYKSMKY